MEYPEEDALNIYTDGSMLPAPRRGGAGLLFILLASDGSEERREDVLPGFSGATQNQMELEAVLPGLKLATGRHPPFDPSRYRKIVVKTDATYVADNFGAAVGIWSKNGWLTKHGKPVDNAKQWKEIVRLVVLSSRQGKPVKLDRVPGKKAREPKQSTNSRSGPRRTRPRISSHRARSGASEPTSRSRSDRYRWRVSSSPSISSRRSISHCIDSRSIGTR